MPLPPAWAFFFSGEFDEPRVLPTSAVPPSSKCRYSEGADGSWRAGLPRTPRVVPATGQARPSVIRVNGTSSGT